MLLTREKTSLCQRRMMAEKYGRNFFWCFCTCFVDGEMHGLPETTKQMIKTDEKKQVKRNTFSAIH